MKKIFYLLGMVFLLASCQKELNYTTIVNIGNGSGTTDTTGSGTTTSNCKACTYFPLCNGSRYIYNDTTPGGTATLVSDTFKLIKDTLIKGKTFQKIYQPSAKGNSYYNCTDGATTLNVYNTSSSVGVIDVISIVPLRANAAVNEVWKDTILNGLGQTVIYTYTMKAKGSSRTVNGQSFSDVLYVYLEVGILAPGFGYLLTNKNDYYYAKGVGLIESISYEVAFNSVVYHRAIKSYYIP